MPEATMTDGVPTAPRNGGLGEWFLRIGSLAEARRALAARPRVPRENVARAHAAFATAERLARTGGDAEAGFEDELVATGLAITLYREAAYWALTSLFPDVDATDLASAMRTAPAAGVALAGGGSARVEAASAALVTRGFRQTAELTAAELRHDARASRGFVEALLGALVQREDRVPRLMRERYTRLGAVLVVLGALVVGVPWAMRALAGNLVETAPWRVSSALEGTPVRGTGFGPTSVGHGLFFHTRDEHFPWIEFDLGRVASVSSVGVENRSDCCLERAVPLALEVSSDHTHWTEVARATTPFQTWNQTFASHRARYVRLRVLRDSMLHLQSVTVQ